MSRQDAVDTILALAHKEMGKRSGNHDRPRGSNKTKYCEWYGLEAAHWSAIWVSWIYHHAGYPLPRIQAEPWLARSGAAYPPIMAKFAQDNGEWFSEPEEGDIVFFHFNRNNNIVFPHCGIVYDVCRGRKDSKNKVILTYEGDTGTIAQVNGGYVLQRRRYRSLAGGYYRPSVLDNPPVDITETIENSHYRDLSVVYPLMYGSDVKAWQRQLVGCGHKLQIDGHYGMATAIATVELQKKLGLLPNGIVDKETWIRGHE